MIGISGCLYTFHCPLVITKILPLPSIQMEPSEQAITLVWESMPPKRSLVFISCQVPFLKSCIPISYAVETAHSSPVWDSATLTELLIERPSFSVNTFSTKRFPEAPRLKLQIATFPLEYLLLIAIMIFPSLCICKSEILKTIEP